ncbi:MAG: ATP-grasp domain-containing protein [Desulfobacterales bacterium]|nr:ATP-grasp domain-containing protein [Desulfobacterales bacterium]MDD4073394.1 ATP-grasp domain-containing protein [Desulfobacterales bacterium]MDD4392002.1 ATP-grasp domain-containing protein [Desulfobacterales bacterium]
MIIGLTYDLRSEYLAMGFGEEETAEFDRDDTIDALEATLNQLGHECIRIGNARQLVKLLAQGHRWDMVFNICEGLHGIGREAQVPALLDMYDIPYTFSDPLVMSLTLHKALTKRVVRDAGLCTPDFRVVTAADDASLDIFPPPYFVKPVAEGSSKGISSKSVVNRKEDLARICKEMICEYRQPVIVERCLTGREFTVGIIGTGSKATVLGTMEILLLEDAEKSVYSYHNKVKYEKLVRYRLATPEGDRSVQEAEALALNAWKVLECRDGGRVDVRCDDAGQPGFLEVNPLAGLNPKHSDLLILCSLLNITYVSLIERILSSAATRIKTGKD